jgi:peptidoglycan hydrolase-like protein with peptidoglycan-binding domain
VIEVIGTRETARRVTFLTVPQARTETLSPCDVAAVGRRIEQPRNLEDSMSNPAQPTISFGSTGDTVRRLERALRRTPDLDIKVDGVFGGQVESAVKDFQLGIGLTADGVVGPNTWAALPDGAPMPRLERGSKGDVVKALQTLLTNGAPGQWNVTPQGIDGDFGPKTAAAVKAFQIWSGVAADGVVGDQTWSVSLHAMNATLETKVGLNFVIGSSLPPLAGRVEAKLNPASHWSALRYRAEFLQSIERAG